MSHVNGYAELARFIERATAAQALASTVGDILDAAVQTATSLGAWMGPPARA